MAVLKSINYWSFPGGLDGTLDIKTFLAKSKEHGYDAVELCIGEEGALSLKTTEQECRGILDAADSIGIKVASVASGIYWSYALASESASDRAKAVDALKKMIQITSWLKCRTLLTIPGAVDIFFLPNSPVLDYAFVREHALEGLRSVVADAERCNVILGIENVWNKFLLSPIEMKAFLAEIESPHVGAYVDVANVMPYGYAEQWLRILGKQVAGIHFKDFRRAVGTIEGFVDLLEGDVNWPEVMNAIREIGYSGPVVAEMIPLYKYYPEVRIANTSRAMDAILGR
jgi:hexulose-6-phosphate isomerase